MPSNGDKRIRDGNVEVWYGTEWKVVGPAPKTPSSESSGSTTPAKPKVVTKGTSGIEETQTKSLSQILAERDEKRKKAEVVKSGGKK